MNRTTFYSAVGDIVLYFALALLAGLGAMALIRRRGGAEGSI
jgi:hypothetical protein